VNYILGYTPNSRAPAAECPADDRALQGQTSESLNSLASFCMSASVSHPLHFPLHIRGGEPQEKCCKYLKKWRAQGDDFRTFLGEFVSSLQQFGFPQELRL
jgi:hypothetical protein